MKKKVTLILAVILFCIIPLNLHSMNAAESLLMKIGWKMQVVQQMSYYPNPNSFLTAYFGTPPYPAVLDIMVPIDRLWQCEDWIVDVSQGAQSYPNAEIHLYMFFDMANEGQWTIFGNFLNRLQNTAVTYTGIDGEHVTFGADWPDKAISQLWQSGGISNAQLISLFDRVKGVVTSHGIGFICYYLVFGDSSFRSRYLKMAHLPWPNNMRESGMDLNNTPDFLGIKPGAIVLQQFPGNPPPDDPTQIVEYGECDWTHEAVRRVFIHTVPGQRAYTIFGSGIATTSFTGVSGVRTPHLWDNPSFREWVWTEMGTYSSGTFLTTEGNVVEPPTKILEFSFASSTTIELDQSEFDNDGVLQGNLDRVNNVERGWCLANYGTDGLVEVDNVWSLNPTRHVTLVAWVNLDPEASDWQHLIRKEGSYVLEITDRGYPRFTVWINDHFEDQIVAWMTPLNKGVWYRLVGVYDGGNTYIYVNGDLRASSSGISGEIDTEVHDLYVAAGGPRRRMSLNGLIDEVSIYNDAWDAGFVAVDFESF
ncbi:MAG: LamG domain-containing protein [Candidatus Bathyarchaeota archaeon]|nr:MAG: LamG domain-containing protein [Candidatus Bathyarchaeota archaeon]